MDPNVFVTRMGRNGDDREKDSFEEKKDPVLPQGFSIPLESSPNTFFLRSSLTLEEEVGINLHNTVTFYTIIKKIPKPILR